MIYGTQKSVSLVNSMSESLLAKCPYYVFDRRKFEIRLIFCDVLVYFDIRCDIEGQIISNCKIYSFAKSSK